MKNENNAHDSSYTYKHRSLYSHGPRRRPSQTSLHQQRVEQVLFLSPATVVSLRRSRLYLRALLVRTTVLILFLLLYSIKDEGEKGLLTNEG